MPTAEEEVPPEAVTEEEVLAIQEETVVVAPDLKADIRKLIEEAPLLSEVQGNAWKYTEWLARLNTLVLQ